MAFGKVPLGQLISYGSSLSIEETKGAGPNYKPRKVVLVGAGLPFQGAEWGFENNVITNWYPGNGTEGTQQNLGPRELPSTWEGEWRRTLMGKNPSIYIDEEGTTHQIAVPHLLRTLLESIFRGGVRLRVIWTVEGTSFVGNPNDGKTTPERYQIVREGLLKTFRTPFDRHTDIRWTMEFHWASRGGKTDRVASVRKDQDLATSANALIASVNVSVAAANSAIVSSTPKRRRSATHLTLGQLENIANTPKKLVDSVTRKLQQNVSKFKRVGDIANKLRSTPYAVANSVVDFSRNTVSVANNFIDVMGRQSAEQKANKGKVSSLLRASRYLDRNTASASDVAREAQALDNTIRQALVSGANQGKLTVRESSSTRAGDIIGVHVSKTGDTPQRVSMRFYSNPDQGATILRANRLPMFTPTFRPGQILIIPALTNSAAQRTSTV